MVNLNSEAIKAKTIRGSNFIFAFDPTLERAEDAAAGDTVNELFARFAPPGSAFYFGSTDPVDSVGSDGDVYLRIDTAQMFQRIRGSYTLRFTIDGGLTEQQKAQFTALIAGVAANASSIDALGDRVTVLENEGGPSDPTEQRVLVNVPASVNTVDKFVFQNDRPFLTDHTRDRHDVNPTGDFQDFAHADYINALSADPPVGSYTVGRFYFNRVSYRLRVLTDTDPITPGEQLGWRDATLQEVIGGVGEYRGHYPSDDEALRHITRVGDVYYEDSSRNALRLCTDYTPGTGAVVDVYRLIRLIDSSDLEKVQARLSQIKVRSDLEEYDIELGDQFRVVDVASEADYSNALTIQRDPAQGDRSARMLLMRVMRIIAGTYQGLADTEPQPYSWQSGDMLVVPPLRDDPQRINSVRVPVPEIDGILVAHRDGTYTVEVHEIPSQIQELEEQDEEFAAQLLDMDVLSHAEFRNALPTEAQIAAVLASSATGQAFINDAVVDPTTIPNTTNWAPNAVLPPSSVLIARVDKDILHREIRIHQTAVPDSPIIYGLFDANQRATDATWDYFLVAQSPAGRTRSFVARRDANRFHTAFGGALFGRALEQVEAIANEEAGGLTPQQAASLGLVGFVRPITRWVRNDAIRTIHLHWRPRVAVHTVPNTIEVMLAGTTRQLTAPTGLAENDEVGMVLSVEVDASAAANITGSSDARAGYVRVDVVYEGVRTTGYMEAVEAP